MRVTSSFYVKTFVGLCMAAAACASGSTAPRQWPSAPATSARAAVLGNDAGSTGLSRWAVLATPKVQELGLADLLAVELGKEPGLTLGERDQIAAALKELTLNQALGAEAAGQRLKIGKLLKADALILLAGEQSPTVQSAEKPDAYDHGQAEGRGRQ